MDYAFVHGGKAFTPNKTALESGEVSAHNAVLESAELVEWSKRPDCWQVYVTNTWYVSTWTGVVLGTIIARRSYQNNFGAKIESVRVKATNGAIYYGRYGADWSQLCRVRKAKGR